MKLKTLFAATAILVLLGSTAIAQSAEDSNVKILPGNKPGIIKVLYALEGNAPVEVRFLTKDGLAGYDKVKHQPNGFLKRYDVNKIDHQEYWIEISSPSLSYTYRVLPAKDGVAFQPYLEKTTVNNPVVALSKD